MTCSTPTTQSGRRGPGKRINFEDCSRTHDCQQLAKSRFRRSILFLGQRYNGERYRE